MFNNWFFYIPLIFFSGLLIYAYKKSKIVFTIDNKIITTRNYLPLMIIGLYVISAFFLSFVDVENWYPTFNPKSYTFTNFLIYSIFIFLYLLPAIHFKPLSKFELPDPKIIKHLAVIMIVPGWFSFLYQLPYAIESFNIGAFDIRFLLSEETYVLPASPLTTLAAGVSYFYLFYIVMLFIAIINKYNLFIKISLFVGSLSYIVNGLTFTTRDVFVFYPLGFFFILLLFKNILSKTVTNKIKIYFPIITIITVGFLLLISLQRFFISEDLLAYGVIGYISQQPLVFSETVEQQSSFYYGNLRFPVFKSFFSDVTPVIRTTDYEWSFGTFVKDFYSTGGYPFLIIMTLLIVPFFYMKIKKTSKNAFFKNLIIILFYFQFITEGIFYFKLGSKSGNIFIIILLLMYISVNFIYSFSKSKNTMA
jgi:hypothetical protein